MAKKSESENCMKYVIIGNSAAGVNAAEAIREKDPSGKITIVSKEDCGVYSRCLLSYYIAGSINEEKLLYRYNDFYKKRKIDALLGLSVESINTSKKEISLSDKKRIEYDKLLIASGASAKKLGIKGDDKKGVLCFRDLSDAKAVLSLLDKVRDVAILGGGPIGMRDGYALASRGKKVKVIIKSPRVLSQVIDETAADIVGSHIKENGMEVLTGVAVKEILGGASLEGLMLDDSSKIACELAIVGKGVSPNTGFLEGSKIKINKGICTDNHLMTNIEDIYAAGDVAETVDISTGEAAINAIWPCAVRQGRVAGLNMAGGDTEYGGSMAANSIDLFALSVVSLGLSRPKGDRYKEESSVNLRDKRYRKLVFDGNRLVGAILVGDIEEAGVYGLLIEKKVDISDVRSDLLSAGFDFGKAVPLILNNKELFVEPEYGQMLNTIGKER